MKKYLIFFILFVNFNAHSSPSEEIIIHFKDINSLEFKFSQKIDNNNIEKGECIISYPKKIFCKYYDIYNKILVSNGKSLIINSDKIPNYYRYPLDKTPLNFILDKEFLISKMSNLKEDQNYLYPNGHRITHQMRWFKVTRDKDVKSDMAV